MKKTALVSILLFFICAEIVGQKITTVLLVRHTEKQFDEGGDPDLNEEGAVRAAELARVLAEVKLDAIYSTPFKRTRQTVASLAEKNDLEILDYNPFKLDEVQALVEKHKGQTIIISGHSNTTPVIVNKLIGEDKYSQLDESDYDNLYIVTYLGENNAKVLVLEYGANSQL